jgi:hypothetical protein
MAAWFLPNDEEQRICQEFMTRFPVEGPGLCYLFGASRACGLSREQAAAQVRALMAREEERVCRTPGAPS